MILFWQALPELPVLVLLCGVYMVIYESKVDKDFNYKVSDYGI